MFESTKNLDTAFRYTRMCSIACIAASVITAVIISWKSFQSVESVQQKIYILANGKVLEALAADRKDNIPVEAKDHVRMFHQYFFSQDPDEKVIQSHISKALYLADRSAKQQYDNLKENGYYASLVSGNISQSVEADSIQIDVSQYPYYFRYQGTEKIIRPSTIVIRNLVTEGFLRNVARSDNNPHGFLIEKWRTLLNNDLSIQNR